MTSNIAHTINRTEQFEEVCSKDFLEFKFGGRGYQVRTRRELRSLLIFNPVHVLYRTNLMILLPKRKC